MLSHASWLVLVLDVPHGVRHVVDYGSEHCSESTLIDRLTVWRWQRVFAGCGVVRSRGELRSVALCAIVLRNVSFALLPTACKQKCSMPSPARELQAGVVKQICTAGPRANCGWSVWRQHITENFWMLCVDWLELGVVLAR